MAEKQVVWHFQNLSHLILNFKIFSARLAFVTGTLWAISRIWSKPNISSVGSLWLHFFVDICGIATYPTDACVPGLN